MAHYKRRNLPAFRVKAIHFVFRTGRPVTQMAREVEIDKGTLTNWVDTWKIERSRALQGLNINGECGIGRNVSRYSPFADRERVLKKGGLLRQDAILVEKVA